MGHIEELSEAITDKNMTTIAIKYLGIEYETVENFQIKESRRRHLIQQGYTRQVEEQNTGNSTGEFLVSVCQIEKLPRHQVSDPGKGVKGDIRYTFH